MRQYGLIEVKGRNLIKWTCSVCDKDFLEDELEGQEVFSFNHVGGYSSVFGDGSEIYIDICQHCFKRLLGEYCNTMDLMGSYDETIISYYTQK